MGLFKWVNKGISVDKREVKTQPVEESLTSHLHIQQITSMQEQQPAQPQEPSSVSFAASALFDRTFDMSNNPYLSSGNQFSQSLSGPTLGNRNILVVAPKTEKDVTMIVENLGHGEACIANFEGMSIAEAQRRLDFLSGVVCAIGGSIKPLDANKYVLTPNTMGIKM